MIPKQYNIILASGSPRRHELMAQADLTFTIADKFTVEEIYPDNLNPEEVPGYLSALKSKCYTLNINENDLLITADTVVIFNGEVIGKPSDRNDALNILKRLNGKTHKVITGVTLRNNDKQMTFSETTHVTFRNLSINEIDWYIDNYQPYDKAGSYGVQEWIGCVAINEINGSYTNVMGLPMARLYQEITNF